MAKKSKTKKKAAKKSSAKKSVAKKTGARKPAAKKSKTTTAKRVAVKKVTAKKSPAKRGGKTLVKSRGAKRQATGRAKGRSRAVARRAQARPQAAVAPPLPAPPAPPSPPKPVVGSFVWHELMTNNAERCGDFYQGLFNWSRKEKEVIPGVTYTVFRNAGKDGAGMMNMAGPDWEGQPPRWIPYVKVRDVEAAVTKAEQLGGRIVVPPSDIAEGRFAVVADPSGVAIGVFREERD